MPSVKTPINNSKRRRSAGESSSRAAERRVSDRSGRRFSNKETGNKRGIPSPATNPRKARKVQNALRIMMIGAVFFVTLSLVTTWRHRAMKRRIRAAHSNFSPPQAGRSIRSFFASRQPNQNLRSSEGSLERKSAEEHMGSRDEEVEVPERIAMRESEQVPDAQSDASVKEAEEPIPEKVEKDLNHADSEPPKAPEDEVGDDKLPERIEWYSRDDYKDGTRPMCRISKPYLLSNGTILVPDWMGKYEKLLLRCGLGTHSFYSVSTGPKGLERKRDLDADFVLTIHPEKFQEPTHVTSVYLTEHILKASYLFDVFGGDAHEAEGVKEHHCYSYANTSSCTLPRPEPSVLKPAIFVPKRIEMAKPTLWSKQMVDMFGAAHGHGHGVLHLNASTVLLSSHKDKSEDLTATGFRSIMVTDGMFRHLPADALRQSNFYSPKNGITRTPRPHRTGEACSVTVGVASGEEETGIDKASEIKEKVQTLSKLAVPEASVETKLIEFTADGSLQEHIKEMQDIDVYLGGSGDQMSSLGYLRSSSAVFELTPFGIKPNTHQSLARALGLQYERIGAKPQVDTFKTCIDGEIFNMRKKGKLQFTESPEWHGPLISAWDKAAAEYALSGTSAFDLLSNPDLKSYYSRICAQKQKIEVGIDETARKIVLLVKQKCASQ